MKNWFKFLCLILVVALILPALVACDKQDNETDTDDGPEDVVLETPDTLDGTTYDNSTFTFYSLSDMFYKKFFFADKTTGDGMNDSLYQRQQIIEQLLSVDFIYKEAEGSGATPAFQIYADEVKNSIKAGVEKYQLVGTHINYSLPDLITTDSLMDFNEFNTIDLSRDYWNKDIMDQVAYKGHYYLGYSDYNLATTYVVAFNKALYNEFESAFDGNTMYDYVNNGQWTLSKMSEVASYVYKDEGDTTKNTYGLTGELWVPFCGFIQSSGEAVVVKNENSGNYELTWYDNATVTGKINNIISAMNNLKEMKETYFWVIDVFALYGKTTPIRLNSGNVFMELMNTTDLVSMKETRITFGVLPYPMYDEFQYKDVGYRSLNWAGYIAVPSNVSNTKMVSDVLECLAFYSEDVVTYFYEKLLGLKVAEAPEDSQMLDIVWDGLCSDFGLTYGYFDDNATLDALAYAVPRCLVLNYSFARLNASYRNGAKRVLDNNLNN